MVIYRMVCVHRTREIKERPGVIHPQDDPWTLQPDKQLFYTILLITSYNRRFLPSEACHENTSSLHTLANHHSVLGDKHADRLRPKRAIAFA